MDEKAATVVAAIEHATRHMRTAAGGLESPPLDPRQAWSAHCSALFRETMRQVASRGHVHVSQRYTDENADANELGRRIRLHKTDWEEVGSIEDAQSMATKGSVVVGSYINPIRGHMGHLGFIYPAAVHRTDPLVRDGDIHRNKNTGEIRATSSYGAVPIQRAFGSLPTKWFRYRHY
jgi:hypothetical protein